MIEIGVEELPANDVDLVYAQLEQSIPAWLEELRLGYESAEVLVTPRRIVIHAIAVEPRQPDEESLAKGPPAERAFDADGNPTKAAEGFARGKGIDVSDLQVQEIDGGRYVTAVVKTEGRAATEVLAESIPELISSIRFGKAMRWNATDVAFSRPIRWLVGLYGEMLIPFAYAGVASQKGTRGLRPNGSEALSVNSSSAYLDTMRQHGIILSRAKRQQMITEQIQSLAQSVDGYIPDDPGLLGEVTNLVESPVGFLGSFEESYLSLPRDVLVTVMRKHQRYFPVQDRDGNLLPYFIAVRNGDEQHLDKVRVGNEQVLRARFADAQFFYDEDCQQTLQEFLPRLGTLTFQEKLGSMLDKNNRVAGFVGDVGDVLGASADAIAVAKQAAAIAKADLATNLVVEMTSLQGIMGREYALLEGIEPAVAHTIFEHWLPRGAGDELPTSEAGVLLTIADRLDSLVGLFAVGLAPKATSDPYGLRRAALGIIQILLKHEIDVDLRTLLKIAGDAQSVTVDESVYEQLDTFMRGRLDAMLVEEGIYRRDVINAVLAQQAHNPARAMQGIRELEEWVAHEDWEVILDNFARCVRITRTEQERYSINEADLTEPNEQALFDAVQPINKNLTPDHNVDGFLSTFVPLVPTIQAFFDHVMVNADDENLRHNRLGLLQMISDWQLGRADLSELSGF